MARTPDPETCSRLDAPFAVGDWEVHPRSNEIHRGTRRVKLEPKVMQVLCFLASRPGAVVSREELEAQAWSGMVVTYDAVTSAIIKLRKALGDEARHPHYIETLSKSGYRLIAEVRDAVPDEPNLPVGRAAQTRSSIAFRVLIPFVALLLIGLWLLLPNGGDPTLSDGGGTVPAPAQTPGIAVLPFVNLGAVPEQDYFADGITEDLMTDLSQLSGLWVVARNSAFAYRGSTEDERTIARELGTDYVLKGSVQRSADRIRINVRLVDGLRGSNLWAERYDRRVDDLFALQDEIAASILSAIEVEIAPSDRARLGRSHVPSIEAYDAFLRGLDHHGRRSLQDTQMAIDHYRRAIAIDPEFARAYAGLALVYGRDAFDGWDLGAEDGLAKAEELIAKARSLDPMVPQIHFVQGQIELFRRHYAAAMRSAEKAIAIKPNYADAHALLAWILHFAGRADDGWVSMERAVRLNPRVPAIYRLVRGALHYENGDIDRALADFEAAVEMSPSFQLSRVWLAAAYAAADRPGDAEWETREILALDPAFSVSHVRRAFPIKDPIYRDRFLEDLRRAGLPD